MNGADDEVLLDTWCNALGKLACLQVTLGVDHVEQEACVRVRVEHGEEVGEATLRVWNFAPGRFVDGPRLTTSVPGLGRDSDASQLTALAVAVLTQQLLTVWSELAAEPVTVDRFADRLRACPERVAVASLAIAAA